MVQAADPGKLMLESEVPPGCKGKAVVKMELEDLLEEEHGPDKKRSKHAFPVLQWKTDEDAPSDEQAPYNVLNDRSPLGLRLRKSPSLLDLIQMRLSQGNPSKSSLNIDSRSDFGKKDSKPASAMDKLKASNFPATVLKIGNWECVSRYEGDLVAKCYFAKRKLVWEVLNGGLKSKIEIQWSDITAIKPSFPESGPDTLDLVVSRPPLFFRETNPQPRKHTLWQATSDFTLGEASRHRRHFLEVPHGLLSKHFEKLICCDPHLGELSRQPDVVLDCPFFEDHAGGPPHLDHVKSEYGSPLSPSTSMVRSQLLVSRENPSTSSEVEESRVVEENTSCVTGELTEGRTRPDQFRVPGIRPSMSMSDFVNQIGQCINEKMASDDPFIEVNRDALEEITQYLLSDSHGLPSSDDPSLMYRVNSLYCLLQKDPAGAQNLLVNRRSCGEEGDEELDSAAKATLATAVPEGGDSPPAISRIESAGDLLLYLPRIASLPQFLFNIAEEPQSEAR